MPGMRLDFLKNPSQRAATGKSMPLKQVEAVLLYGRPEQRAKVVQKILPNAYALCLSKASHHLLLSILAKCDGLIRVQMLYHLRRKIRDLSFSPVGNTIVQEMLEKLPIQQRREIAEVFVLNAEADEFRRLCEHPFGNHVAQKIMEHPSSREVLEERFVPHISFLAVHPYGQRVVVKYMESTEEGWRAVSRALFGTDEERDVEEGKIALLFQPLDDNMTVSALLRHPLVSVSVKDAICAHLCEYAAEYLNSRKETSAATAAAQAEEDEFPLPDFGYAKLKKDEAKHDFPRHYHAYVTVFGYGDIAQRKEMWESLRSVTGLIERIVSHKTAVAIAVAAFKTLPESQESLWAATTMMPNGTVIDVIQLARDPARTMLLRAMIESCGYLLTADQRKRLAGAALELSQDPVSSPVLQKLLECFPEDVNTARLILENIRGELRQLVTHDAASYLIQAMLQYGAAGGVREELVNALLDVFSEIHEMLSFAQGSRVMQKLVAYASDEAVLTVVNALLREAEQERKKSGTIDEEEKEEEQHEGAETDDDNDGNGDGEKKADQPALKAKPSRREQREINRKKHYKVTSRAIVSYALHNHACYVIQAILRECRSRQLEHQRKQLMDELKPFVFELAVSPWAGRIVLETMFQSGSAKLAEVMKNVVFLKAEAWLSDVPEKNTRSGSGLDPTMRQALRRHREEPDEGRKERSPDDSSKKPPRKKLYRTLKK
ncbi:putative pumilio/PUF RNA binding protein 7 [Trypanosoma cruzi]|uniref:Pumilio/PUF RNA binding protein 7, putative n=3 Tax=Trypanosoma cruzi TaxID=5693 RepID=Q4D599_TRYCC|nr:pumilio/PUF RNA binding protein 7, putative [Trypanosoma cruzi]AAQ84136.1 pumilio protein 7 [Trypanosoma cruzi]EAN87708.1 pumilio/PUF RNA binding protein 7, putative [Trypanosoma cruzi]PWV11893.1 putative pumilio/PUF RNA binding protein 7 [Trypanosoma cruzi]|eukprot:XP_809559.1 pumilio/PUF RNA binding protein 7 [Trypanosoma cruzi strain CL Brener]